jgi:hypothetical protein
LALPKAMMCMARARIRGRFKAAGPSLRFELGSDPHQMPPQPVDQPGALAHQLIAVITEHPDLMGLLIQERNRQVLNSFADRCQRDRPGIDRVRLPRRP